MYFPYFMAYMGIGLVISLTVFFWALKNGQFRDQQRARFLPLRDDVGAPPVEATRAHRLEIYGLFLLACGGLAATAAVLAYALYFSK
ncbi:MAG: cbb3-type cytochrome oxidase assembly protein CcoS [Desulfatitalea sp.]|nr:cbb3-type cytochrome oxidase assembly protein CcoS [Desulfatitalea sp.]NNK02515.1 cbb3-type cytochrome oxidase assembly protein CcoS [Desulfatitalea sp.]